MPELRAYYKQVIRLAYKWGNRRSQKQSFNWRQFQKYLKYNPLPRPKIFHLTYASSSGRSYITEEPYAGNLHVRFCEGH